MRRTGNAILVAAVALLVIAAPARAQPPDLSEIREQVVIVRAFDAMGRALGDVSGFAVGGEFVATNAALLAGAENVVVVLPETRDEFPATVVVLERRSGVAVLRADGFGAGGLRFAVDPEPAQGEGLYLPRFAPDGTLDEEAGRGSISELRIIEPTAVGERDVLLYRHNSLATAREYGMPLLNNCGEVVGALRTDPGMSRTALHSRPDPGPAPFAVAAPALRQVLVDAGAAIRLAEEPCLDPAAAARQQAAAAEAAAEAASEARDAAQQRAAEAVAEAEAAGEERDAAQEEAEAAEEAAAASQAETEAAEAAAADSDRQRRSATALLILVLVAAAAVVLLLARRIRRRREAQAAAEKARLEAEAALKDAPRRAAFSCLLHGADEAGRGYALKISAEQLGSSSGVVVGRTPAQAGALLDHPEASREHFRLTARGDDLFVTDLHSTNGTFLNGERLEAGGEVAVADGAEIGVGSAIAMHLRIERNEP